jgi:hypothetical protein
MDVAGAVIVNLNMWFLWYEHETITANNTVLGSYHMIKKRSNEKVLKINVKNCIT